MLTDEDKDTREASDLPRDTEPPRRLAESIDPPSRMTTSPCDTLGVAGFFTDYCGTDSVFREKAKVTRK